MGNIIKEPIKELLHVMPASLRSKLYAMMKSRPIEMIISNLENRNIDLSTLNALEVFGKDGEWHTLDYAYKVKSLEMWEIDENLKSNLHKNFPFATIKIVDSFEEVKRCKKKFNFIVIDNPMSTYSNYCEHFELFPDIFNLSDENAIFIVNVIPEADDIARIEYPYLFNDIQLQKRSEFYNTISPEKVDFEEIEDTYKRLAWNQGMEIQWSFFQKRNFVYYYVFSAKRLLSAENV